MRTNKRRERKRVGICLYWINPLSEYCVHINLYEVYKTQFKFILELINFYEYYSNGGVYHRQYVVVLHSL